MKLRRFAAVGALATLALIGSAHAAALATDGTWAGFAVDGNLPPYSLGWTDDNAVPLSFEFAIAPGFQGTLTVVDLVFSGDRFSVTDNGNLLGLTSLAVDGYDPVNPGGFDANTALAQPAFSRGVFTLGAGSHRITGTLSTSLMVDGQALDATLGAVRLEVSAVPEPATLATLLAGLSLLTVALRRRGNSK